MPTNIGPEETVYENLQDEIEALLDQAKEDNKKPKQEGGRRYSRRKRVKAVKRRRSRSRK